MLDVIGLELLKAFGRLWLHPLTYIFILAAFFLGIKRVKRERKDFHTRVYDVIHELTSPVIIGLCFGFVLSIIFSVVGLEISIGMMVLLTALWILFLPFRKVRWLSMTFIASLALIISNFLPNGGTNYGLLNDWLAQIASMNLVGFAWILVALFLSEALLVIINGWKETSPRLLQSKRGKTVGSHEAKKLWPIPILLLLPIGSLSFEGWWPIFPSTNSSEFGLMFIPFLLGFQLTVQSQYPRMGIKKVGKHLLVLSIVLAMVAAAASYFSVIVLAVAVIGLLGREFIYLKFISSEKRQGSYFKQIENGLTVLGVLPHSTAEKMGIEVGEVISKVNGYEVFSQRDIYEALQLNSAYCKLEVLDRDGEKRFAQSSIHEGDHYQIGLLFVPDGEMTNLSARGLRSSVVIHNDRNGSNLTLNELNKEKETTVVDEVDHEETKEKVQGEVALEGEESMLGSEETSTSSADITRQENGDSSEMELAYSGESTTDGLGMEQDYNSLDVEKITDDLIEAIESLPTSVDKREATLLNGETDSGMKSVTESTLDEDEAAAAKDQEVISKSELDYIPEEDNLEKEDNAEFYVPRIHKLKNAADEVLKNKQTSDSEDQVEEYSNNSHVEQSEEKEPFQKNLEIEERRAETGESPYGQAAGLNAFYEEFRNSFPKRETWKPKLTEEKNDNKKRDVEEDK